MKKHSNDFGNDSVPGLVLRTSIPLCSRSLSTFFTASLIAFISEISRRSEMFRQAPASARPSSRCFLLCNADRHRRFRPVFDTSRSKGSGKSKNLLGTSFSMLLVFSAALTILFLLLKAPLLQWFGASKTTFPTPIPT